MSAFLPKDQEQGSMAFLILLILLLKHSLRSAKKKKKKERHVMHKTSLFADNMMVNTENPKKSAKKLIELISSVMMQHIR